MVRRRIRRSGRRTNKRRRKRIMVKSRSRRKKVGEW